MIDIMLMDALEAMLALVHSRKLIWNQNNLVFHLNIPYCHQLCSFVIQEYVSLRKMSKTN